MDFEYWYAGVLSHMEVEGKWKEETYLFEMRSALMPTPHPSQTYNN